MILEVPGGDFGGMQETGLVSGREGAWHCQSASSLCFWPARLSGGLYNRLVC